MSLPVCTHAASPVEVLPALAALGLELRRVPLRPAASGELSDAELVLVDGRDDLPTASLLCHALVGRRPVAVVLVVPASALAVVGGGLLPAQLVLPDAGAEEVRTRLALARSRVAAPRPAPARVGALVVPAAPDPATLDGEPLDLSPREHAVLSRLASAPVGRVWSRDELLEHAWGTRFLDPDVVGVVVRRLRAALGPYAAAVVAVPRVGYRLDPSKLFAADPAP